jgi:hypothetical protein
MSTESAFKELEFHAARCRLGVATGRDLVQAAVDAMLAGCESDNLTFLAGEIDPNMWVAEPFFKKALADLSIEIPSEEEAFWILLRRCMSKIANEEIAPSAALDTFAHELLYPNCRYNQTIGNPSDPYGMHEIFIEFEFLDAMRKCPSDHLYFTGRAPKEIAAAEAKLLKMAQKWIRDYGD